MGRWAQSKRRGSTGVNPGLLGPPPAPTLEVNDGHLWQYAQFEDDVGGRCQLWQSETENGVYSFYDEAAFQVNLDWGPAAAYADHWWKALQIGGGQQYVGTSDWSGALFI